MFTVASLFVLATMVLALLRAVRGPTVYDRIVAVNVFGTMTVLLLVLIGFLTDRPEFEDIALLYVLINFVAIIAVLKFELYSSLAGPRAASAEGATEKARDEAADGAGVDGR
ncbi:monovalent cation/H+ antiporter complex subunit F [Roseospira goensis]|uniref:Multicomponent Na+:H+ antiporter subunit F n=1 Tax=Roseospira goensis TaxID=391922 RepID=A0A7W6RWC6_9PROT|nr:monovalent cation/H+ antiporter complex subunit F [Roseospira goensis]MBB4284420.1 multicomponent Na+:H+ antiporter subunit F [Roseospira goensis]